MRYGLPASHFPWLGGIVDVDDYHDVAIVARDLVQKENARPPEGIGRSISSRANAVGDVAAPKKIPLHYHVLANFSPHQSMFLG